MSDAIVTVSKLHKNLRGCLRDKETDREREREKCAFLNQKLLEVNDVL